MPRSLPALLVALLHLPALLRAELPPIAEGPYQPTWQSLTNYSTPEWFRDAKLGFWAHWGPQCEPEHGGWYARDMYRPGNGDYIAHLKKYGHPSKVGFKDVIHQWKAANFDPDQLVAFYKESGAKYFMALANHHDNFDLWPSKHQPWNSVAIGPKRDLVGDWTKAVRKHGLPLGLSIHGSRAWSFYETAQGSDTNGPYAGVPYDGKLTKADGKGQWWEGLDPQDLYAQNHKPGAKQDWSWNPAQGSSTPDQAYLENFFLRTKQVWDDYRPDLIYFDDYVLPFHGVTDEIGLKLAAHFYNTSVAWNHGTNQAVMNTKKLDAMQRKALVYDIERGKAEGILPEPWQTDTCIGGWHYNQDIYKKHQYKTAATVVPMLADIVSKNGNLMLSVPLRRDGTLDDDEVKIVTGIGDWMKINGEAIYATRPWTVYGEGPSTKHSEKGKYDGQNDTQKDPFTPADFRFTRSKDGATVYAIALGLPADHHLLVRSLASAAGKVDDVTLLGHPGKLEWKQTAEGLAITLPDTLPCDIAVSLKISGAALKAVEAP